MKKILNKYGFVLGLIFVYVLFSYITYCTPLCGDDWGYALNGLKGNPISTAISFYQTWSGRFFSELWGFVVAPRKWLWNIINPILFTSILYCIYRLCKKDNKNILIIIVSIALMLSVDDYLRMETYSWIMGTTYVIPLFLSLIYFVLVKHILFDESDIKKNRIILILSNLILLYIGFTMENIAAMMIVATLAITIYAFIKKKEYALYFLINVICSAISFIIMRLSPGSSYRLINDHPQWAALSIIDKIINGYPNFIYYTFINNNYLILFLSGICVLNVFKTKMNIIEKLGHIIISAIGVFAVFSFVLIKENNIFIDQNSLFSSIFWIIYTIDVFVVIIRCLKDNDKVLAIFFLCLGGGCNVVMMYSPIFGARCSLYTVYFLIIVICLLMNNIVDKNIILIGLLALSIFVIADRSIEYAHKYSLVKQAHTERLEIIKYYQEHPEETEAWIPRYPIYTVHSGDVESDDTYHINTFKEYYGLTQDTVTFYYKEG